MTPPFIDPRTAPIPPYPHVRPRASEANDLAPLMRFCREGRIYDVEEWIRSGKPLGTDDTRRVQSPLRIAIDSGQHDLALLLLCNGFPADTHESLLTHALYEKNIRFVDLLLTWGADAQKVDVHSVLQTYAPGILDRFWALGLDFSREHKLARELARSSARPLYGWAKRHHDDPRISKELAIALADAITEDRERAVALLLWAGADPHIRVPSLRYNDEKYPDDQSSALEYALIYGKGKLVPRLKPDPTVDNFDKLWASAADLATIEYLAKIQAPSDWSVPLLHNIRKITWGYGDQWETRTCIEKLGRLGARIKALTPDEVKDLRRSMLRCREAFKVRWVLGWMKADERCDRSIYEELIRTPAMRRLAS